MLLFSPRTLAPHSSAYRALAPWAAALLMGWAGTAAAQSADGLSALASFLKHSQSASASFTQTVLPPQSAQANTPAAKSKSSSGSFAYSRPNRFRLEYTQPYAQTIVADGHTLWQYDADLEQAIATPQAQALAATPVALITSARSLQDLQAQFTLQNWPAANAAQYKAQFAQWQWVQATPKAAGGTILKLRVGFAPSTAKQGAQLRALEIHDSFGQRSIMEFTPQAGQPAASQFQFKAPEGTAVMHQ